MGMITPTFAQPSENSSSYQGDQTCNSPSNNYPHKSSINTTTESKRAVKQLIRYLKGTRHTCLRLELHGTVQKVCWNSLVVVTQIGPAFRLRAKQDIIAMCMATICNRSLKQTAISLSSCEAEFYAASACAENQADSSISNYDGWIREKRLSVGRVDTKNNKYCRSLHETSGRTENAVARKETWTSNLGRYE